METRSTPHTVRTIPVLAVLAIGSMVFALPLLVLTYEYAGTPLMDEFTWLVVAIGSVVPACLIAGAILLIEGSSARRRGIAAATMLVLGILYAPLTDPIGLFAPPYWLSTGVVSVAALAIWFVACGHRDRRWLLLLVPAAFVGVWQLVWLGPGAETAPFKGVVAVGLIVLPFVGSVLGASVAARAGRQRGIGGEPALQPW